MLVGVLEAEEAEGSEQPEDFEHGVVGGGWISLVFEADAW